MVEENGSGAEQSGEDSYGPRYFGPFGEPSAAQSWSAAESRPSFDPHQSWAPPTTPAALPPFGAPPPGPRPRSTRPVAVVAIAAATALLVGGGAGFGGARLARPEATTGTAPASTTATATAPPEPSASATTVAPLPPAPDRANTVEIAKRALPGTVMIQVGDSTGSGFVIDTQGRIITNNHVVAAAAGGAKIRVVFADGARQPATLLGRSPSYDLAVIKVQASGSLDPIAIGNSDQAQVGQPVVAIGSPLGLPGTVTQGIVSARDRPVVVNGDTAAEAPSAYINAIQTDASINPGNSGGPLVDAEARVIGVNSAILTMGSSRGQTGNIGLGFAIPINQARVVGDQLIKRGMATYPVLGANVRSTSGGVEVTSTEASGPAAKAGLRQGDLITEIDGQAVEEMEELIVTIRTRRPGQSVDLAYTRGSSDDRVRVTLGSKVG